MLLPYITEAVLHCCDISGTDDGGISGTDDGGISGTDDGGIVVWISDMVWSVGMSVDSIAN